MKHIRPKNWHGFQHYKERDPPWIKLHKRLLDDFEFNSLPVASKALAPMLWLLASEHDNGDIPAETRKIAYRLRMTLEDLSAAFQPLITACFFEIIGEDHQDASVLLAECEPVATPEKRVQVTSTETEAKAEKKRAQARVVAEPLPDWVPLDAWNAFVEMRRTIRAPLTTNAVRLAIIDLDNLRATGHDPAAVLEQSVMRSWRGLFAIEVKNGRGTGRPQQQGRGTIEAGERSLAAIRRASGEAIAGGEGNASRDPHRAIAAGRTASEPGGIRSGDDGPGRGLPVPDIHDRGEKRSAPSFLPGLKTSPGMEIAHGVHTLHAEPGEVLPDSRPIARVV